MSARLPQVRIGGAVADPCSIPLPLSVTHGRSTVTVQPDPPSTEVTWIDDTCPWTLGDDLQVWADTQYLPATYDDASVTYDDPRAVYDSDPTGVVSHPHFAGTIAGIEATAAAGQVQSWRLTAVGYLARLGFVDVTLTRPAEVDTARAAAIAAAAGVTLHVLGPPGVTLAAAAVEGNALAALHDVCTSTGGLLWQARDGSICYGTAEHRLDNPTPVGVIACETVQDGISWTTAVEDLINEVTVSWGPDDVRQETTHQAADSIAQPWGVRAVTVDTQCAAEDDADELAVLILARRAWPYWAGVNGVVDLAAAPEQSRLFSTLDVSSPVLVPIPAAPGPTPSTPTPAVVEGWVETWTEGGEHLVDTAFSDQRRWVLTTLRDYAEVLAEGDYAHWRRGDYLNLLVRSEF